MLFVNFGSAFKTVVCYKPLNKLRNLRLTTTLCSWILDFLTNRWQNVHMGTHTTSTLTLNTGGPHLCVLSPAFFIPHLHNCSPIHSSNTIVQFAGVTTIAGLIPGNNETHWEVVQHLVQCGYDSTLVLNTTTRKIILDLRKSHPSTHKWVEMVANAKFIWLHIAFY